MHLRDCIGIFLEEQNLDISVGDIIEMKKPHPCGEKSFLVLRVGMDFKIRCTGCGREVMLPRSACEKNIRHVKRQNED
jgi:hypothetical protein